MNAELEQVEGIPDWPEQDIMFREREPAIINAERELAKSAPLFLEGALLMVKDLAHASCKLRNGTYSDPKDFERELKFLKQETGHLKDVCQSYGYGLAGQVAALMYQMLDRPVKPDMNMLRDFEIRLMMLASMLK